MRFLVVVFCIIGCAAYPTSYSEAAAKLAVQYSGASYCCGQLGHGCENWSCEVCKHLPYVNTTVLKNNTDNVNGYVGYDAKDNVIIVAFAGTDPLSIKNWIDDIDTIKVDYPCPAPYTCKVHQGFWHSFRSVQTQVEEGIKNYLAVHPDAGVMVTGHSLGAAIAVHAALFIKTKMPPVHLISTYVFGLPRLGNKDFANWASSTLVSSVATYHITHHRDPIPHLPPLLLGFRHIAGEIYYNERNSEFTVCDGSGEDPHCAHQFFAAINLLDHLTYMNFSFTANYLTCKL